MSPVPPSRHDPGDPLAPLAVRSRALAEPVDPLGLESFRKVYLIWLAGASCEGCTVAVTGATHPRLEQLLSGAIPGLPRVELVHSLFSTESGSEWVENLLMAERGELDAPYVLTWEGSVMDESLAGTGSFSGIGEDPATGRQVPSSEWLERLAPGAAAVIAVGTCAAWGGIPAAAGNPTGARGLTAHLGDAYRSAAGVPVINVPGCAPLGDNYTETVAALLLHLNGLAPPPELDDLGRPAWLFTNRVHRSSTQLHAYEEGVFSTEPGSPDCLVQLGCLGPVVQCNIADRGVIDGHGGCLTMGGICIGCTMPGFPDRASSGPEARAPEVPAPTHRATGGFLRRLRSARARRSPGAGRRPAPAMTAPRFYLPSPTTEQRVDASPPAR